MYIQFVISSPRVKEEDFGINNVFSLYKFYGYALAQESMPPVIKFTLFGHQYHILSLSGLCPGVVKNLQKNKTNINVESPLPPKKPLSTLGMG